MQDYIEIAGVSLRPGQTQTINLPLARLYTHTEMTVPIHVMHGKRPGPRLFITAAVHGDELNGVEIVRRLMRLKLLAKVRGTLILVPIVNIYGFVNGSRYLPDRRDLNRAFPGSATGSLASQLARLLTDEIVERCTHGIDLHTGSNHRSNLPQIRACLEDAETERFARAFSAPVILDARLRDGSLREAAAEKGVAMLLYEAGEAHRFDEFAIRTGVRGILSAMRAIGQLPNNPVAAHPHEPVVAKSAKWVRAPGSGIFTQKAGLGKAVEAEELIGVIGDPFSDESEAVRAPLEGVIVSRLNLPLVHRGDALFQIASVEESASLELSLPPLNNHGYEWPVSDPNR